jgi:hypothetical protein
METGDAVTAYQYKSVGLVVAVSLSRGLAWVNWPAGCGLSECLAISDLNVIADSQAILRALQSIAPQEQDNKLIEAFFHAKAENVLTPQDQRQRPYYDPKANRH